MIIRSETCSELHFCRRWKFLCSKFLFLWELGRKRKLSCRTRKGKEWNFKEITCETFHFPAPASISTAEKIRLYREKKNHFKLKCFLFNLFAKQLSNRHFYSIHNAKLSLSLSFTYSHWRLRKQNSPQKCLKGKSLGTVKTFIHEFITLEAI